MIAYWCFNCLQPVETEDIFVPKKHKQFYDEKLSSINAPLEYNSACVCQDCLYYRIHVCAGCHKGAPLCMFSMEEWFSSKPLQRKCLDCTASHEMVQFCQSIPNMPVEYLIVQCHSCSKFKYVCSFVIFPHEYKQGCCHRAIKDGSERHFKYGHRNICIECLLDYDIRQYRKLIRERYDHRVSQEPALKNCKEEGKFEHQGKSHDCHTRSYASALIGIQNSDAKIIYQRLADEVIKSSCLWVKENQGTRFIIANFNESICSIVSSCLKSMLVSLKEKVVLELGLKGHSEGAWCVMLHNKLKLTAQMFSLQGTEVTDFTPPEARWAYIAVYTAVHASIVSSTVTHGSIPDLSNFISSVTSGKEVLDVCCFGAGPGSEVLGLSECLQGCDVSYHLFDHFRHWEHNAKCLLQKQYGIGPCTYDFFDVTKPLGYSVKHKVKKAKFFTFVRFLSAIQYFEDSVSALRSILSLAPPGSVFLIIDNLVPQLKNFVESLVFPDQRFSQEGGDKESAKFRLLTSYVEFHLDIEDISQKYPGIVDYLAVVLDWVDRPPLVDLRLFVFVAIKKEIKAVT